MKSNTSGVPVLPSTWTFGVDMLNNTGITLGAAFLLDFASIGFLLRILRRKLESLRSAPPSQSPAQAVSR